MGKERARERDTDTERKSKGETEREPKKYGETRNPEPVIFFTQLEHAQKTTQAHSAKRKSSLPCRT